MPGTGIEPVRGRPRGIFLPATAFAAGNEPRPAKRRIADRRHLGSGLYLCPVARRGAERGRQGPSSLYTFRANRGGGQARHGSRGLARYCRHLAAAASAKCAGRAARCGCFTDFDPIHTRRFRAGCSISQVPCVYQFRHPGDAGRHSTRPRSPCGSVARTTGHSTSCPGISPLHAAADTQAQSCSLRRCEPVTPLRLGDVLRRS